MHYRVDIQILRGISVLLVVLFHLDIGSFQSGFLGVDVFFVISGFLMAVLYDAENIEGFFRRRAVRLLPAFYTTIFATVLLTMLLTTRNESKQVFEQAYMGSIFASNIGFWFENSYFSSSAFKPLLHLWSLGVEIQFYLIIPLLAYFFRKSKWILVFITFLSAYLCFFMITISPKTSFFVTPFRVWEFLIGYSVATFCTKNGNVITKQRSHYGLVGLFFLIAIPLLPVNGESMSYVDGHPGIFSLLVALSTGVVLHLGIPDRLESSTLGTILSKLGEYSYSIYLVHFPVIVIYNSKPFMGTIYGVDSYLHLLQLLFIITVTAVLLHVYVERKKLPRVLASNWKTTTATSSILLILFIYCVDTVQKSFLDRAEKMIFSAEDDRAEYRCGKTFRILNPSAYVCELTGIAKEEALGTVILAGNSHADSLKPAFVEAAKAAKFKLYFFVSNSVMNADGPSVEHIVSQAKKAGASTIFVHQLATSFDSRLFDDLISEAEKSSINVIYVEPVPIWDVDIPSAMWKANKEESYVMPILTIHDYFRSNKFLFDLRQINTTNFKTIPVITKFCDPNCEYSDSDGKPLYFDSHHLTKTGAERLKPLIEQELSRLKHNTSD
jgi:peptidoglycan/LPS O-acetylase OafA/YrhL